MDLIYNTTNRATVYTSLGRTERYSGRSFRPALHASLLALWLPLSAVAQEVAGLGDLPGGDFSSYAEGVSADGSVVVGYGSSANGLEAFRWTQAGGMQGLGDLAGGYFSSTAQGVSADGSVVIGRSVSANGDEAFRWTQIGGMQGLGDLAGGAFSSIAQGVSADGSVVVGYGYSADGPEAFRWTQTGGMQGLGDLAGGDFRSHAEGVSADGSVVVGSSTSAAASYREAFRWTQAGGMQGLGDLPGGGFMSFAYGASADGSVVVGYGESADGLEAFRWTQTGGMQGLGHLTGGDFRSHAFGVSADGSVVVGFGKSANGDEAFRWSQAGGMETVTDWLATTGVAVPAGFSLNRAFGVSGNGSVIVGNGTNGDGNTEAWIARSSAGVLSLDAQLQQSLGTTAAVTQESALAVGLILNGAHHRPLMIQPVSVERNCFWASGDLASYDHGDKDADSWLAEVGGCRAFGSLLAGIGIGKARVDQNHAFGGNSDTDGEYLLAELDYQPQRSPWLLSLTALYGHWDATINRGYLNAGAQDSSRGDTDLSNAAVRARIDWPKLAEAGGLALTPRVQYSVSRSKMAGYTESGGGFPVRFNSQHHTARELRVGVMAEKALTVNDTLHLDLEGVHRFDEQYARVSGQVISLFSFDQNGSEVSQNWLRAGVELDHQLDHDSAFSLSLVASGTGEDPDLSGAVSFRQAF